MIPTPLSLLSLRLVNLPPLPPSLSLLILNPLPLLNPQHKFSEEIAGMIKLMQSQQKKQLEGIEEFRQFCARESSNCSKNVYRQFMDLGHQALAKAAMAAQWLQDDLNSLSSKASKSQLTTLLSAVNQRREMVSQLHALSTAIHVTVPIILN